MIMNYFKYLLFFLSTISLAQSSFEVFLPVSDNLSVIGKKSIVTDDGILYVASPMFSGYTIGGSSILGYSYSGTKIWKLNSNGELLDSSTYPTADPYGWNTSYCLFNSNEQGQVVLLYSKTTIESCGNQIFVDDNYEVGAYVIDENTLDYETYNINAPCEYEQVRYSHFDGDYYSRFYVDETDSLFFEKRTGDFDLVVKKYVPIDNFLGHKFAKRESGYVIVNFLEDEFILVHLDESGNIMDEYVIISPYEMDTYAGRFNYIEIGGNEVITYTQSNDGVTQSYVIAVNNGLVVESLELDEGLVLKDVCKYDQNLLVLATNGMADCLNNTGNIKVIMLSPALSVMSESSYGQEFTNAYDITLTNDGHFLITGGKYIPSECLADGEEFYPHTYLIKSSLKDLNTTNLLSDYNFSISPNPTNQLINISLDKPFQEVCVRGLSGEIIEQFEVDTNKVSFDLSEYNTGVYIVGIRINDKWYNSKVILE